MSHVNIETFRKKETSFYVPRDDTFAFRKDLNPRWHWLQRAAIWTLKKLGAYAMEKQFKTERIRIDADDVIAAVGDQRRELLLGNRKPGLILMGFDQFTHLRLGMNQYLRFDLPTRVGRMTLDGPQVEIMGLPVYTVPHMNGVLVLPDKPDGVIRAANGY